MEKLLKELEADKNKAFAEPVINHLIVKCETDEQLAKDIMQEHKTWQKCQEYILGQAKTELKARSGAVRSDIVFGWAEAYYHLDDKAEEERKKKEAEEYKRRQAEEEAKRRAEQRAEAEKKAEEAQKEKAAQKLESKVGSKKEAMEGQMDIFSLLGV